MIRQHLLSVLIVNYNTGNLLKNCVDSIYANKFAYAEIIVVDNGSNDGSPQLIRENYPNIKLIANNKNYYFSHAHNQALKECAGKFILILNSDTKLPKNNLKNMLNFMRKNPNACAASCREINERGKLNKTCSRLPNPITEFLESNIIAAIFKKPKLLINYRYAHWQRNTIKQIEAIPGSYMFIRKSILDKTDFFDQKLKLFYSDIDLCLRIKKAGGTILFNPDTYVIHLKSQSVNKLKKWSLYKLSIEDMLFYYKKHFGFFWWLFLWITYRPNWLYWKLKTLNEV